MVVVLVTTFVCVLAGEERIRGRTQLWPPSERRQRQQRAHSCLAPARAQSSVAPLSPLSPLSPLRDREWGQPCAPDIHDKSASHLDDLIALEQLPQLIRARGTHGAKDGPAAAALARRRRSQARNTRPQRRLMCVQSAHGGYMHVEEQRGYACCIRQTPAEELSGSARSRRRFCAARALLAAPAAGTRQNASTCPRPRLTLQVLPAVMWA